MTVTAMRVTIPAAMIADAPILVEAIADITIVKEDTTAHLKAIMAEATISTALHAATVLMVTVDIDVFYNVFINVTIDQ
ncbi:hypothetical protein [Granulosicoccus antarcticus]|uniref:hypothetical protein n=1 Tax=Granulosicoccus antarcticus TaxID=437505 RepID=UPI0012FD6974|nr:hypothetical protein [Granulosicoccus antarcticus]